jgi:hypothetical protein
MRRDCSPFEIELRAENEESFCLKQIIDLRRPDGTKAFYLGKWKSYLIVHTFNEPLAGRKPYREIGVGGSWQQVASSSAEMLERYESRHD